MFIIEYLIWEGLCVRILTLKKSNCKNCYKCIRYCPIKSIKFSNNQATIVDEECILCGQCFVICPQNAKEILQSTDKVKELIQANNKVIVSLAPSFIVNYEGVELESIRDGLKKLGFYDVEETAIGATLVKNEYERLLEDEENNIIISSCCHSVNLLIQKHYPKELKYLANIVSPMQAHCIDIKKRCPDAKTVFIGPCVSKKDEAEQYKGIVDYVLTFEELTTWLREENIILEKKADTVKNQGSRARFFPTTGGILKTMCCHNEKYNYISIDGVENCISVLKDIENGHISNCFIEMSACKGSCIGGPVMDKLHYSYVSGYQHICSYAGNRDFEVQALGSQELKKNHFYIGVNKDIPDEDRIKEILKQMGKTKIEHELNCGTCGYNTCREKAIAVYQGKADPSMCLPFFKEKAESFSDNIINNSPNGIIVLNDHLEVQQVNKAALNIMNIRNKEDVIGEQVVRILDPQDFMEVRSTGISIRDRRTYLAEYKKYVEEGILYDREYNILICIMRDITKEEVEREKKEKISRQTIDIADKVVNKQMRVVQEIASLLGETTAETKIALTKLKESISNE